VQFRPIVERFAGNRLACLQGKERMGTAATVALRLLHVLWCEEESREPGVIGIDDWKRALQLLTFDLQQDRAEDAKDRQAF